MARTRCVAVSLNLTWSAKWQYEIYSGIQRYARESGQWRCVIDEYPQTSLPARRAGKLAYDGIICRATLPLVRKAERLGVPLVNTWFSAPAKNVPSVFPDFQAVGRANAEHLLARGFRRFSYFVAAVDAQQRLEYGGFRRCVEKAGCRCEVVLHPRKWGEDARKWVRMRKMIRNWLSSLTPPVAVYVEYPVVAQLVLDMCEALGLSVPQDVAIIVGFDDPVICEHASPGLSCVGHNFERVGYESARLLNRLMRGRPAPKEPLLVPPAGVVKRASTDFFAVQDELVARALRHIAANLHKPIDVHDVVAAMAVSKSTLQRAFRTHVGVSMSAEITRLRMEKAKRMLAEPERRTLKQIASETGFRTPNELCRVFRRELGITPGRYRKQVLGERR